MFRKLLQTTKSIAPTIARVCAGVVMFAHGAQKMLGWFGGQGYEATVAGMSSGLGLPAIAVTLVVIAELFGSLGLIFGFLTRVGAIGIAAVMVGAIVLVHWPHGFFMNWMGQQAGEGFEYHLLMIGTMLALAVSGGGRWSVDRWIVGHIKKWRLERESDLHPGARPSAA